MVDKQGERAAVFPSIKDELKNLILQSLQKKYVSESCKDGIQTGNHYQSVSLGNMYSQGFRAGRREFLDQINFEGKKVLDLGSNLGEVSRASRARGAYLVDGFEYDPYFLEIANLINAYNEVTRVSFYQRDITDHSIYGEHYDIVVAFSVFTYIQSVLNRIADITDQVFVLETHKLNRNLERDYLAPLLQYFPYYSILGDSEWGGQFDAQQKRAVIIFAKQEAKLAAALKIPFKRLEATPREEAPGGSAQQPALIVPPRYIDVKRTCLQKKFFINFAFDYADELLAAVKGMHIDLETIARCHDFRRSLYSGWVYWLLFVKGYLQYITSGTITSGNIYYDYLTKYFIQLGHDPGLCEEFANPLKVSERVERRFQDFDFFRQYAGKDVNQLQTVAPVLVIVSDPPSGDVLHIYEVESDIPLRARLVDGWHRLFSAKLWGIKTLQCEVVYESGQFGLAKQQGTVQETSQSDSD